MASIPYNPETPLSHPAAADFIPKYLHTSFPDPSGRPDVRIRDDFYGTRRKLRIGILGAGISSINFLHFATQSLTDVEYVVWERNEDVGGVWLTSRYPGCRCDIPSIVYQFSWRPKRFWSEFYAPAKENLEYIQEVAREEGFYRFVRFRREVERAEWRDEEGMWTLRVKDLGSGEVAEEKVHLFLELNGPVSSPRITPLQGIEDFKGEVVHPAYWNDDITVDKKRVALIGYGCSGVQIAPNIVDRVSKLYTWFRNKTYILPPPNQAFAAQGGANFKYSDEQKELLSDPDVYLAYRKAVDEGFYRRYPYVINGSQISHEVKTNTVNYMTDKLASKPDILASILPTDFDIGCRRQTFAYGYMEALTDPKTTVFTKPPERFTAKGILDADGNEHQLDMVIAATGYDQSHLPRYPKIINGASINDAMAAARSPPSYMALMLRGMPNYFNPSSAFGPLPQGNFYQSTEAFGKYMVKCIDKMQVDRIVSITPKDRAVEHFVRHSLAYLKRTAVMGPCVAWYKGNESDRPPALWPGARSQFLRVLETPRFEDFEIVYENEEDMFAYMGNGWTVWDDAEGESDRTWYMGQPGREVEKEVIERLKGTDESVEEVVYATAAMDPKLS